MKKIIKSLFIFTVLAAVLASCKKDENRINFEGGTDPVFYASDTTPMILSKATAQHAAVTFTWTNPEYQFTTGISSQDVTYYLQADTVGSNFTTPGAPELSIANDLSINLTDSTLNAILSKFGDDGLVVEVPHQLEFRIKSTLTGKAVPLYSNSKKITITPYLDVAVPVPPFDELFLVGSATPGGWTNPVAVPTQQFSKVSTTSYEITLHLNGGQFFLGLPVNGSWSNKYAVHDNGLADLWKGGDFGYNGQNSYYNADIPGPPASGNYKVTFNFKTGKFTTVKL